jgi:NAD(P)-dependent dehydrogenase (short-subunit alcohol dehydrogenase family)
MTKTWLVTGAGRGLGRSICEAALAVGDRVMATARNPERLADLKTRFGDQVRTFSLDVTDPAASKAAVEATVAAFDALDVLVNNAGYGHVAPFEQTSAAAFREEFETNFFGVVNLVRAALPILRRQRSGTIVNISSVGGRAGSPGLSAYQSAKFAVGGFTEVLAQETAPFGVKVIALEPGGMRTDWGFSALEGEPEVLPDYAQSVGGLVALLKDYAGSEVGDPARIAKVVVDLVTHDALPHHLLLGSDALHVYGLAETLRTNQAKAWDAVSRSTDFDQSSLSLITDR